MKNTTFESAADSQQFASTESAAQENVCSTDVARLAKIHVKPEDIDDFLFYYGIAEEYGLEIEYLQSILNGLTPAGAAYEWDL